MTTISCTLSRCQVPPVLSRLTAFPCLYSSSPSSAHPRQRPAVPSGSSSGLGFPWCRAFLHMQGVLQLSSAGSKNILTNFIWLPRAGRCLEVDCLSMPFFPSSQTSARPRQRHITPSAFSAGLGFLDAFLHTPVFSASFRWWQMISIVCEVACWRLGLSQAAMPP